MLLALLGATAGQGVVWYTGQFYALFFLTITLKVNYLTAYLMIAIALLIGTPFFIFFGWLSDRIGRLKIILAGCLIAALTYFPLFHGLTTAVNPALAEFQAANPVVLRADPATCGFHIFVGPWSKFTDCDKSKDFLTKAGLSFTTEDAPAGTPPSVSIGQTRIDGWDTDKWNAALAAAGYPKAADPARDKLGDGRGDPGDHDDLRHHGLRPDRRLPGRALPDPHPLHVDVAALPHRQWLVRRNAAIAGHRNRRGDRQYL